MQRERCEECSETLTVHFILIFYLKYMRTCHSYIGVGECMCNGRGARSAVRRGPADEQDDQQVIQTSA